MKKYFFTYTLKNKLGVFAKGNGIYNSDNIDPGNTLDEITACIIKNTEEEGLRLGEDYSQVLVTSFNNIE